MFFAAKRYIMTHRPKVYMLENVSGLVSRENGAHVKKVMKHLKMIPGYEIVEGMVNTKDHGIPQCRVRWYCFGCWARNIQVRLSSPQCLRRNFKWGGVGSVMDLYLFAHNC